MYFCKTYGTIIYLSANGTISYDNKENILLFEFDLMVYLYQGAPPLDAYPGKAVSKALAFNPFK